MRSNRRRVVKFFPLERITELERAIAKMISNPRTRRDGLGIALGLHGLRVSEVCFAEWDQLDVGTCQLWVCPYDPETGQNKPLKHGVERTIDLHPSLVEKIVDWRKWRTDTIRNSRYLLPNRNGTHIKPQWLSGRARRMLVGLGMSNTRRTRFHMLRHTCAMRILTDPDTLNDVQLVMHQLGHASLDTTMQYLALTTKVSKRCLLSLDA